MTFRVSDHALIRYLERVHGVNLDPIRKEISDKVEGPAECGARRVVVDGATFEIRDKTVTTVLFKNAPPKITPPKAHATNGRKRKYAAGLRGRNGDLV